MGLPLRVENVSKRFGGLAALDGVSLQAMPGEITSIIGQNGAGKTTLLNTITQLPPPDGGQVFAGEVELTGMAPHKIPARGVVRTFQQLRIFSRLSVLENVLLGFQHNTGERLWNLVARPGAVRAQRKDHHDRARGILAELELADMLDVEAGTLSYGLQKLLSLARAIATDAQILMLDEPTSGLSGDFVARILAIVKGMRARGRTVVLVEHDMDVVFDISDRIVVLDHGRLFAHGTPAEIRGHEGVREIYFGSRVA
ncbi:MAG: ABC transporter ATP-binding protein [Bradyrhizobiaceae bacterium]|nr:ABC transporter ATP-binding protein [Bradyrhizobiaceae bacterium]